MTAASQPARQRRELALGPRNVEDVKEQDEIHACGPTRTDRLSVGRKTSAHIPARP
jgi:hypothetical protein